MQKCQILQRRHFRVLDWYVTLVTELYEEVKNTLFQPETPMNRFSNAPFYLLDILNIHEKADQETSTSCSSEPTRHRESAWGRMKCLFPIPYTDQGQISEENHSVASDEVSREQFCVGTSQRAEGKAPLVSARHPIAK